MILLNITDVFQGSGENHSGDIGKKSSCNAGKVD